MTDKLALIELAEAMVQNNPLPGVYRAASDLLRHDIEHGCKEPVKNIKEYIRKIGMQKNKNAIGIVGSSKHYERELNEAYKQNMSELQKLNNEELLYVFSIAVTLAKINEKKVNASKKPKSKINNRNEKHGNF